MIDGLLIPIPQRLLFIRITVCISLIISIFLSFNLWAGERIFPYAALYNTKFIKPPYDYFIIAFFIFCIIASLFLKKHRLFILLALLIGSALIIIDTNRLQPWFYFYFMFLFVLMFYDGRIDDANKFTSFFIVLQLLFCSVYIYNGISQLNTNFVDVEFPQIISSLKTLMSERQFLFVKKFGVLIPYYQLFVGIGLLIRPVRYLAITFAVLFHSALIIFLAPSGANQNYAMWFFNVSFIPLLFLLFSGKTKQRYYSPTLLLQFPLFYLIVTLFWILPAFNKKNSWPDNLSGNFKGGNINRVEIKISKTIFEKMPGYVKHFCYPEDTVYTLDYNAWCRDELSSNCFQEKITFNNIYNYIKTQSGSTVNDLQIEIKPKQNILYKP